MHVKRIFTFIIVITFTLSLLPGPRLTRAAPQAAAPAVITESSSQAVSLPEGISADWWAQAQEYIEKSEYEITWQEPTYLADLPGAYQAPNRAQGLRTYFTAQGLRIVARTETEPAWQLGISLAGYGGQAVPRPVSEAALFPAGNRMDYPRTGLAEWYLNDESGLQQNIVLPLTAVGESSDPAPTINIDLALQGNLTPVLAGEGRGVEFYAPDGSLVLCYGDLQAVDAAGQAVPVGLSLFSGDLSGGTTLRLSLQALAWPMTLTARMTSPPGAEGAPESLSLERDWYYKGTPGDSEIGGSVATAGDVNGDGYDDIIVGAWIYDNGNTNEGRVFVWYGGPQGLCETGAETCEPAWTAEGNQDHMNIGYSVGTAGDVNGDGYDDIIAGAPFYNNSETDEGGAFVWHGSSAGLGVSGTPENADWKAESNQVDARFGNSVGTAGDANGDGYDDVIVGAWYYENPTDPQVNEGAVFVWQGADINGLCKTGETPPGSDELADADWKYESDLPNTGLGFSVGTAGDVNGDGYADIIVGTPYSDEGYGDRGKAYVWLGSSGGMGVNDRVPNWSRIGEPYGGLYGWSVGTAGDVDGDGYDDIIVGQKYYDNPEDYEGAVFVYYGAPGSVGITDPGVRSWMYESNQVNTDLGTSVATAGDINGDGYADIIAGFTCFDHGQTDEGAVGVWYGSAIGMGFWQRPPDWKVEIDRAYDYFGYSVSTAGDVNGDGYSDLLVGAPGTDGATYNVGEVYAYYGSPGGPLTFAGAGRPETQGGAQIGYSVNTAGDVNGDGYSDIIVGTPYYDGPEYERGKVYVWYGAADSMGLMSTPPDWQTVGEQGTDWFGFSVGTAGDVNGDGYDDIIVGSRHYPIDSLSYGAAYVWYGSETGLCQAEGVACAAAWKAEGDPSTFYSADFGFAVGTAGDIDGNGFDDIIVGAPYYDVGGPNAGGIFVWYGAQQGLCPLADPQPPTCKVLATSANWKYKITQGSALFGWSLGAAGDLNGDGYADIIVGDPNFDDNGIDRGRVYVWYGAEDGLCVVDGNGNGCDADWERAGDNGGALFGTFVSSAGDVNGDGYSDVLVGSPYYNNGHPYEGAVYAWYGSANGLCEDDQGAACARDWMYESNQVNTDLAGVSSAGDVNGDGYADIVAGAQCYESALVDEGAVFIWYGSSKGIGPVQRAPDWMIESDLYAAHMGWSVGTAGDVNGDGYSDIIFGAHMADSGSTDAGQVYLYLGGEQTLSAGAPDVIEGEQENAQLGYSVGNAGDVNGDGYGDVIVGVPYFDRGQSNEGIVYVYYGSATGIVTNTIWLAESNQASAEFGKAVSSAGDVNGDGYSDILVGAPGYDNGQNEEGTVFVWHGSLFGMGANGTPGTASWQAEADQAQAYFGSAVAAAGDVNGDGYADVIAGAYGYDHGQDGEGQALVYYGSSSGLAAAPAWTAESDQVGAALGRSVGSAGDVNGDGYSDVIVGAYKYTDGQTAEGRAYVYYGALSGLSSSAGWTADGDQAQASFGYAVGSAGDVNGDGYSDVIVGAYQYDYGDTWRDDNEGAAFVWYGSAAGLGANGNPANAGWLADGDQAGAQFGYVVGSAGDVNGDGYSDVLVGSQAYNNGPAYEGRVFVYYGTSGGPSLMARWMAEGDQEGAALGSSAAAAGDVNGDGFADVIVGAPTFDHIELLNTDEDVGQARVYYGNGRGVLSLRPRQLRPGAANPPVPIAPLGVSNSPTSVQLRLTGLMPLGRERFKLEWQIAPLGTPFTATTVITGTSAAWIDTGDPTLARVETPIQVTGLTAGTNYCWRVRLVYSGNRLGLGASRWFSLAWNGWQELDFRSPAAPAVLLKMYLPTVVK